MASKGIDLGRLERDAVAGDWREDLVRHKNRVSSCLANAVTVLGCSDEWRGRLAWDEFSHQVVKLKPPPWHPVDKSLTDEGNGWTDTDDTRVACWLHRRWGIQVGVNVAAEAVAVAARRNSYHPVRRYLDALTWDGKSRLASWLTRYLGAPESPYTQAVGCWWMISAVARVYQPGCKVDHVLILEGRQGLGKSTALKVLAGPWFLDTPFELATKDAFIVLRGRWIVELQELGALIRAEPARAKAFFSSASDVYRPPHGRRAIEFPRQSIFAGTVNLDAYLRDETGGRRYWPILCLCIDLDALERDRDQLWAEARTLFHDGRAWWPETRAEHAMCAIEQDARHQGDAWEGTIARWLGHTNDPVSVEGVLMHALEKEKKHWTRADEMRVAACLLRLGRRRVQQRDPNGRRIWVYVPADDD